MFVCRRVPHQSVHDSHLRQQLDYASVGGSPSQGEKSNAINLPFGDDTYQPSIGIFLGHSLLSSPHYQILYTWYYRFIDMTHGNHLFKVPNIQGNAQRMTWEFPMTSVHHYHIPYFRKCTWDFAVINTSRNSHVFPFFPMFFLYWLVVSSPLKNMSQLGWWQSQYMEK